MTPAVLFFSVVVCCGGHHHRNPPARVSAQLPGAAEGVEAAADADRRDDHGGSLSFICSSCVLMPVADDSRTVSGKHRKTIPVSFLSSARDTRFADILILPERGRGHSWKELF